MIRFNEFGQGYFYFAEFEKSGTTTKANVTKLPVAQHLSDEEYKMFLEVYANHNSSMGLEVRKNYNLSDIVKVVKGNRCLKVYYENGDWWHYTMDGTWY